VEHRNVRVGVTCCNESLEVQLVGNPFNGLTFAQFVRQKVDLAALVRDLPSDAGSVVRKLNGPATGNRVSVDDCVAEQVLYRAEVDGESRISNCLQVRKDDVERGRPGKSLGGLLAVVLVKVATT